MHEHFIELYGERYLPSQWFMFSCEGSPVRYCQPDGLLFDLKQGIITIVEIKYQHTPNAWYQVRQLYLPVLRAIFPADLWDFRSCEVVKWYDPAVTFPQNIRMTRALEGLGRSDFGVHIWKP